METVGRSTCRNDYHRTLSVTAPERLQQVTLFGLGRKAGGRPAALYVHDDNRKLGHYRQSHGLGLQRKAGTGGRGNGEMTGIGGTYRRTDAGDFILALYGLHAEVLALGEFFENDGRGGDGIRTAVERPAALFGSGDESPCRRLVAVDAAVTAFGQVGRLHVVRIGERMRIVGIVMTGLEREDIRLGNDRIAFAELVVDIFHGMLKRLVEHEEAHAQRKHVLALHDTLHIQVEPREGLFGHGRDVGDDDVVILYSQLGERVTRRESRTGHALLVERIAVDDYRGAFPQPAGVSPQGGRIHGHQHVAIVTRCLYRMVAEMYLKSRYTGHSSLRCANFGRIIRESRNAVALQGRGVGEQSARQLHSVPGVPGEPDNHVIPLRNACVFHNAFKATGTFSVRPRTLSSLVF